MFVTDSCQRTRPPHVFGCAKIVQGALFHIIVPSFSDVVLLYSILGRVVPSWVWRGAIFRVTRSLGEKFTWIRWARRGETFCIYSSASQAMG